MNGNENGREPAFPMHIPVGTFASMDAPMVVEGLTKREYAAIQIAAGISSRLLTREGLDVATQFVVKDEHRDIEAWVAHIACTTADAVLARLAQAKGEAK